MASFTVTLYISKRVEHLSQDVVLVIDRSGSMQSVEAKDASGNQLENGFLFKILLITQQKLLQRL